MYYYAVMGTRKDNGVEELIESYDSSMNITDAEARESAMEHQLIARLDPKYRSTRVVRKMHILK